MDNSADVTFTGEGTDNYFGSSVSGCGDVNGDTFDDVIAGAPIYNSSTGRAYVYFGAAGSSMDNIADVIFTGEGANNLFGNSVSGAGDVNGDTFDDVIVGAYGYNTYTGRAYVYFGAAGSSMDNIADVTFSGEGTNNSFGWSVSGAGDVNGDTFNDVIVGAYDYNSGTGRAYIYFGAAGSGMDNSADVTFTGEGIDNRFGWSVSGAGDVNNDTFDDVIVGASRYISNTGRAYAFFGAGSSMDNTADVTFDGEGTGHFFGYSVSGAGDVNNDGYDDLVIAAFQYPVNGRVYVYGEDQQPIAITLSLFSAVCEKENVVITWTTETEVNHAGFNIFRSTQEKGEYRKINEVMIPAQGNAASGASYRYVDKPGQTGDYYYKLESVSLDGSTSFAGPVFAGLTLAGRKETAIAENYSLYQNYPNPFNPTTTIEFGLPSAGFVNLSVFDINGKLVRTLVSGQQSAGDYRVTWDRTDEFGMAVPSGIYFYRMTAGEFSQTRKMTVIK